MTLSLLKEQRRAWLFSLFMLGFFYLLAFLGKPQFSDSRVMFSVIQSVATRGEIDIDTELHRLKNKGRQQAKESLSAKSESPGKRLPIQRIQSDDGRQYAIYGLGQVFAALPFYKAGLLIRQRIGTDTLKYFMGSPEEFMSMIMNPILTILTCLVYFKLLQLLNFSTGKIIWFTLMLGLGTNLFSTSRTFFMHPLNVFLALLSFYLLLCYERDSKKWRLLLAGFLLGYGYFTRITMLIFLGLFCLYLITLLYQRYSSGAISIRTGVVHFLLFVSPFVAFFVGQAAMNYAIFSTLTLSAYFIADIPLFSGSILEGMRGLLISPSRSFFIYSPVMIVFFLSLRKSYRQNKGLTILMTTIFLVHLLLYARNNGWFGGYCFGPRYLNVTIPFLMVLIAQRYQHRSTMAILVQTGPLFLAGFIVQFLGSITYFYPCDKARTFHEYYFSLRHSQLYGLWHNTLEGNFETWLQTIWHFPSGQTITLTIFGLYICFFGLAFLFVRDGRGRPTQLTHEGHSG